MSIKTAGTPSGGVMIIDWRRQFSAVPLVICRARARVVYKNLFFFKRVLLGTQKHRQRAVQVLFGTGGPPPGRDPVDVVDEMDDVALENGRTDGPR